MTIDQNPNELHLSAHSFGLGFVIMVNVDSVEGSNTCCGDGGWGPNP
jgi:hypothetical protein